MKKKDILKKIEEQVARGILNPNSTSDPVGLRITKQALKKSKQENDDYYKSLDKKFKDYLKMDSKETVSPKVNATPEDHEMYYGTGMEGLKYDDEGTEKYKKFVERNKKLNEPSKDYYLKKDQVEDSFGKITKDGDHYKKHKYGKPDEYQKTPKVRITTESKYKKTMKQLTYKKPFLSHERAMTLIPEGCKLDGNKFRMTDGVETYTIKWESNNPTILSYKNGKLVKEDVSKMKHLYNYNSQDTLMKTNDSLTENQIFMELMGKSRQLVSEQQSPETPSTPAATTTTPAAATTPAPAAGTKPGVKTPTKPTKVEKPQTYSFTGKVGDEMKDVTFYITYLRKGDNFEVTSTKFVIDGKIIDNPSKNTVMAIAKNVDLYPAKKSKFESVYTIVNRALSNEKIKPLIDTKKLLQNAKDASLVFGYKYSEPYSVKPQTIKDVSISFYPYKIVDQITGAKEACKMPTYFSINYKGTSSDIKRIDINSLKEIGEKFKDSDFGIYALSDKSQELFKQIKQLGVSTCNT